MGFNANALQISGGIIKALIMERHQDSRHPFIIIDSLIKDAKGEERNAKNLKRIRHQIKTVVSS